MKRQQKTVVFLPSEIQTLVPGYDGAEPVFRHYRKHDGKLISEFYSTGRLEAAIKQCYRIVVLEGAPLDYEGNTWWRVLVSKPGLRNIILPIGDYQNLQSDKPLATLKKLYGLLELPWDGKRTIWLSALGALAEFGIKRGDQIGPIAPAPKRASEAEETEEIEIIEDRPSLL